MPRRSSFRGAKGSKDVEREVHDVDDDENDVETVAETVRKNWNES